MISYQESTLNPRTNKPNIVIPRSYSPVIPSEAKTERSLSRKQLKPMNTIDHNEKKIRE